MDIFGLVCFFTQFIFMSGQVVASETIELDDNNILLRNCSFSIESGDHTQASNFKQKVMMRGGEWRRRNSRGKKQKKQEEVGGEMGPP